MENLAGLAIYRDFRDPDTPCPPEWQKTMYSERPYTCGRPISGFPGCGTVTFSETANLEYSKVCGCIKAYQFGTALGLFSSYIYVNLEAIWTFSAGITQSQVDPSLQLNRCPCDGGPDIFGEHYFCESLIEEDNPGTKYNNHFFHNEVLWDEAGDVHHQEIVVPGLTVHISYDICLIL